MNKRNPTIQELAMTALLLIFLIQIARVIGYIIMGLTYILLFPLLILFFTIRSFKKTVHLKEEIIRITKTAFKTNYKYLLLVGIIPTTIFLSQLTNVQFVIYWSLLILYYVIIILNNNLGEKQKGNKHPLITKTVEFTKKTILKIKKKEKKMKKTKT